MLVPSPWPVVNTPSLSASWVLSSKIYMADLDSALHYILRVEVGKFSVLEGQRLVALKKFMAVLAQVSRAPASLVHTSLGSSGLAGHLDPHLSPSAPGCYPAISVIPCAGQGRPPSQPTLGRWLGRAGPAVLGMFPLSPSPQSEPGVWPPTSCRGH